MGRDRLGCCRLVRVRDIGNHEAILFGFIIWIISGLLLVLWAYDENKKGVLTVNIVNILMAISAIVPLLS